GKLRDEFGMLSRIFDAGMTEDFQPRALWVVHQEQRHPVGHCEVTRGKQLAVALVVSESKRGRIDDPQKSRLATAMLNVRPAGFADSSHVETVARLDEIRLVFRKRVAFRRTLNALRFSIVMCLRFTHGIREDNFVKFVSHSLRMLEREVGLSQPSVRAWLVLFSPVPLSQSPTRQPFALDLNCSSTNGEQS